MHYTKTDITYPNHGSIKSILSDIKKIQRKEDSLAWYQPVQTAMVRYFFLNLLSPVFTEHGSFLILNLNSLPYDNILNRIKLKEFAWQIKCSQIADFSLW